MIKSVLAAFLSLAFAQLNDIKKPSVTVDKPPVTVHIVMHSHTDAGWQNTIDQYYYRTQYNYGWAGKMGAVHLIITTVTEALFSDPQRRYVWADFKYFQMWWREQTETTKQKVRYIVRNRQLEFANGGWAAHDEACPNFQEILFNQMIGHQFIKSEFGDHAIPKIGWMVDSFGHSATTQQIFADLGYEATFFARLHQEEREWRKRHKELQFIWKVGKDHEILAHAFSKHYNSPDFFSFDGLYSEAHIVDDPDSDYYNVDNVAIKMQYAIQDEITFYKDTGHILFIAGNDFSNENAYNAYYYYEKLITYMNSNTAYKNKYFLRYSTPSEYIDAIYPNRSLFSVYKQGRVFQKETEGMAYDQDMYPYMHQDQGNSNYFWTGFFSSRANLKRQIRRVSQLMLNSMKLISPELLYLQLYQPEKVSNTSIHLHYAEKKRSVHDKVDIRTSVELMMDVLGQMTHHDAITGTSPQQTIEQLIQKLDLYSGYLKQNLANQLHDTLFHGENTQNYFIPLNKDEWQELTSENLKMQIQQFHANELLFMVYSPECSQMDQNYIIQDCPRTTLQIQIPSEISQNKIREGDILQTQAIKFYEIVKDENNQVIKEIELASQRICSQHFTSDWTKIDFYQSICKEHVDLMPNDQFLKKKSLLGSQLHLIRAQIYYFDITSENKNDSFASNVFNVNVTDLKLINDKYLENLTKNKQLLNQTNKNMSSVNETETLESLQQTIQKKSNITANLTNQTNTSQPIGQDLSQNSSSIFESSENFSQINKTIFNNSMVQNMSNSTYNSTKQNLTFFENEIYIEDWQNSGYKIEAIGFTYNSSRVKIRLHYPNSSKYNTSNHGIDYQDFILALRRYDSNQNVDQSQQKGERFEDNKLYSKIDYSNFARQSGVYIFQPSINLEESLDYTRLQKIEVYRQQNQSVEFISRFQQMHLYFDLKNSLISDPNDDNNTLTFEQRERAKIVISFERDLKSMKILENKTNLRPYSQVDKVFKVEVDLDSLDNRISSELTFDIQAVDFDNQGIFFTDSNSLKMIPRKIKPFWNDRNYNGSYFQTQFSNMLPKLPMELWPQRFKNKSWDKDLPFYQRSHGYGYQITENFYPVTSCIKIVDNKDLNFAGIRYYDQWQVLPDEDVWGLVKELAIYNDRTQAGTSIRPGSIELIQHRRLQTNDPAGVGEILNEVEGYYYGIQVQATYLINFKQFYIPKLKAVTNFTNSNILNNQELYNLKFDSSSKSVLQKRQYQAQPQVFVLGLLKEQVWMFNNVSYSYILKKDVYDYTISPLKILTDVSMIIPDKNKNDRNLQSGFFQNYNNNNNHYVNKQQSVSEKQIDQDVNQSLEFIQIHGNDTQSNGTDHLLTQRVYLNQSRNVQDNSSQQYNQVGSSTFDQANIYQYRSIQIEVQPIFNDLYKQNNHSNTTNTTAEFLLRIQNLKDCSTLEHLARVSNKESDDIPAVSLKRQIFGMEITQIYQECEVSTPVDLSKIASALLYTLKIKNQTIHPKTQQQFRDDSKGKLNEFTPKVDLKKLLNEIQIVEVSHTGALLKSEVQNNRKKWTDEKWHKYHPKVPLSEDLFDEKPLIYEIKPNTLRTFRIRFSDKNSTKLDDQILKYLEQIQNRSLSEMEQNTFNSLAMFTKDYYKFDF